jgi:membrane-associated protein
MWEILSGALLWFIQEWGEVAIFLIFLLEESGVPLPLPGDLVLIWAGYRVASGQSHFVVVLLAVELASLIGASALYWLGLRGGRPLIVRYGRFLHVDEAKLRRAEGWVGRYALLTIFLGRIVPGFRIVTTLAAGVFHVPYRTFLPALAAGTLVNTAFWIGVGFYFGPGVIAVLHGPELTAHLVVSAVLLAALAVLTWRIRGSVLPGRRQAAFQAGRARKIEAAVLAGLLATFEVVTALVVILAVFTAFPIGLPGRPLLQAVALIAAGQGTALGPAFAPVEGLLAYLTGILWAIAYVAWIEPWLRGPDWLKGATFSLVPTLVSWFVVLPALGAGPLGLRLEAGPVLAAGELARHLLYGVALGLAYPMLLLARGPWVIRRGAPPPGPQPAG